MITSSFWKHRFFQFHKSVNHSLATIKEFINLPLLLIWLQGINIVYLQKDPEHLGDGIIVIVVQGCLLVFIYEPVVLLGLITSKTILVVFKLIDGSELDTHVNWLLVLFSFWFTFFVSGMLFVIHEKERVLVWTYFRQKPESFLMFIQSKFFDGCWLFIVKIIVWIMALWLSPNFSLKFWIVHRVGITIEFHGISRLSVLILI